MPGFLRVHSRWLAVLTTGCLLLGSFVSPAAAQYGGITGLFLLTSPDDPGRVDFKGLGCEPGDEVVLYLPAIAATPNDPTTSSPLSGRVLAVTSAHGGSDPLESGTYIFEDIRLPPDLEPGIYEFHSRCGDLDVSVVAELGAGGGVRIVTSDEYIDRIGAVPEAIPFTGRQSNNLVALAAALVTAGLAFIGVNRRSELARSR